MGLYTATESLYSAADKQMSQEAAMTNRSISARRRRAPVAPPTAPPTRPTFVMPTAAAAAADL